MSVKTVRAVISLEHFPKRSEYTSSVEYGAKVEQWLGEQVKFSKSLNLSIEDINSICNFVEDLGNDIDTKGREVLANVEIVRDLKDETIRLKSAVDEKHSVVVNLHGEVVSKAEQVARNTALAKTYKDEAKAYKDEVVNTVNGDFATKSEVARKLDASTWANEKRGLQDSINSKLDASRVSNFANKNGSFDENFNVNILKPNEIRPPTGDGLFISAGEGYQSKSKCNMGVEKIYLASENGVEVNTPVEANRPDKELNKFTLTGDGLVSTASNISISNSNMRMEFGYSNELNFASSSNNGTLYINYRTIAGKQLDAISIRRADIRMDNNKKLITGKYQGGIYGTYEYQKAHNIWSMGEAYKVAEDGSSFGNLYGAAYAYCSQKGNSLAGGHQFVWCNAGTPYIWLGTNLVAMNDIYARGTHKVAHQGNREEFRATSTSSGGIKVRLSGTTLYITSDGSNA